MALLPWRDLRAVVKRGLPSVFGRLFGPPRECPSTRLPAARLVFRVGVTGHLSGTDTPELRVVAGDLLSALGDHVRALAPEFYSVMPVPCDKPAELRLLAQLAAGADQLAANLAAARGYRVYGVLPFPGERFAEDIEKSKGAKPARDEFDRLMSSGELAGTFELPCDDRTQESRDQAYAEANRVILNQIDLLIVMARPDSGYRFGGSVWMRELALDQRIPVISIPLDHPHKAELIWTQSGTRQNLHIYNDGSANWEALRGILKDILVTGAKHKNIPHLTCQYLHRVTRYTNWDHYGDDATELWDDPIVQGLGASPAAIDANFRDAYCWADHLARGYAEIYRGTFVLAALMGTTAVAAAVFTVPFAEASASLKLAEVLVIAVILWLYYRERKVGWRLKWINYRQMAEQFRHARYLFLIGRSIPVEVPKHMTEFHEEAAWENWYVRALLRQAALPNACLDRDYLEATRWVLESRQVAYQSGFYQTSREQQHSADKYLERRIGFLVWTVLVTTSGYLVCKFFIAATKDFVLLAAPWIMVIGALFPACAAALTAIKSNGEYAQNAVRYHGMASTLKAAGKQLGEIRGWIDADLPRGYERLVKLATATADYLLQEVYQWRSMLQLKGIERS